MRVFTFFLCLVIQWLPLHASDGALNQSLPISNDVDRTVNYASKDSGADVLESSPGAKGAKGLLLNDKDKYCITPCQDKLSVILQLSEDITMKNFVLSSYEKYSSKVKDFEVYGSSVYPAEDWKFLGNFTARPGIVEQDFPLTAWVRYLKFKFLTHHGDEYLCSLSQIKVHGKTAIAGAHADLQDHAREIEELQEVFDAENSIEQIIQLEGPDDGSVLDESRDSEDTQEQPDEEEMDEANDDTIQIPLDSSSEQDSTPGEDMMDESLNGNNDELDIVEEDDEEVSGQVLSYSTEPLLKEDESLVCADISAVDIELPIAAALPSEAQATNQTILSNESMTDEAVQITNTSTNETTTPAINTTNVSWSNHSELLDERIPNEEASAIRRALQAVSELLARKGNETNSSNLNLSSNSSTVFENTPNSTNHNSTSSANQTTRAVNLTEPMTSQNSSKPHTLQSNHAKAANLTRTNNTRPLREVCLESLNFTEFKERVRAKVAAKTMNKSSDVDMSDSVFKTLMGKLKTLEISHSILQLYVSNLHICYTHWIEYFKDEGGARDPNLLIEFKRKVESLENDLDAFTPAGRTLRRQIDRNQERVDVLSDRVVLSDLAIILCVLSFIFSAVSLLLVLRAPGKATKETR